MKADLTRWAPRLRSSAAFSMLQISDQDAIPFEGQPQSRAIDAGIELDAQLSQHNVSGNHVLEFSHNGFSCKNIDAQSYRCIRLSNDAARIDGEDRLDLKGADIEVTAKRLCWYNSPQAFMCDQPAQHDLSWSRRARTSACECGSLC